MKPKISAEQLVHPKNRKSRFNGDKIRPVDKQGFMARRAAAGLNTVEGSVEPSNVKQSKRDVAGFKPPVREIEPPPSLTRRQEQMLSQKKGG